MTGADISYCQEAACKSNTYAYLFARLVEGADIEYCKKHMDEESLNLYLANKMEEALK